jgi:hypothetical protein
MECAVPSIVGTAHFSQVPHFIEHQSGFVELPEGADTSRVYAIRGMMPRSRQRILRDRKKLLDSLRAYKAGDIVGVAGEEAGHFIASIERRLATLNALLGESSDSADGSRRKPSRTRPLSTNDR